MLVAGLNAWGTGVAWLHVWVVGSVGVGNTWAVEVVSLGDGESKSL